MNATAAPIIPTPPWLDVARAHIGTREIPGKDTAPAIAGWLTSLKAWWRDDETPWCGVFVAFCLKAAGQPIPEAWYRARSYLEWGSPLVQPCDGAIVVYERKGGGHVGFVVGVDEHARIMTLGGNQGDSVNIVPFDRSRVAGYRWPTNEYPYGYGGKLTVMASAQSSSMTEA